ncbi:prolyl endopeptidase-like isoform X1 [Bradysia coprophila]|uniref:prolyl endopeptidase-like isoform X1 n=1 Tax=Bradysia coprophila TaxID=38358 RepID=UPI00187D76ED|nr:prolyl endopeptidase-like isoform X1 [Bradysia coprophila]
MIAYVYQVFTIYALISFIAAADLKTESVNNQRYNYPSVRRDESVVDDYYGIKVADPYRYLEDPTSEEVKKFIEDQNKLTDEYLGRNYIMPQIEKKILETYNYTRYDVPERYGDRYYFTMNNGLQNQDVYYVQNSLNDEPRVFFDPNTLSTDGTVHLSDITFSEDGQLVALGLSSNGSDWMSVRFRNTSSGMEYPDVLHDIKFSDIVWSKDGLGIFYACFPKSETQTTRSLGTETYQYGNQKLYYHRVGTRQGEDVHLLEFNDTELLLGAFDITDDGNHLLIFPEKGDISMVYFASLEELQLTGGFKSKITFTAIVEQLDNEYSYIGSEGSTIYLITNDGAPNYRIIAVDLNKPEPINWSTLVPEHEKNSLQYANIIDNDKIILEYLVDVNSRLEVRSLIDGKLIQVIDTPVGSVDSIWGKKSHNELFYRVVSFLIPGIIYRVGLTHTPYQPEVFREIKIAGFDASKFVAKQVFYPSYDGTLIPMFIIHKQNLVRNRSASALLYGYGGFNIPVSPAFSPSRIVFLQNLDGVYAIPNIRGGGEYGSKWHEAGQALNKQTVFDDFQAAAEYLINENYTTASKIAINGGSNGGLLVSACINQRPDLYGAAVDEVGVHDLLRFQKFTIGYAWCPEYGCSEDGNQTVFENLYRLSPLHNVRMPTDKNVQYPSVLLTTGDHDDRVVPLHSYKLIAELQYKIGREERQRNPLLIKIQTSTGHGGGKSTSKRISETADIYAFLVESAVFTYRP